MAYYFLSPPFFFFFFFFFFLLAGRNLFPNIEGLILYHSWVCRGCPSSNRTILPCLLLGHIQLGSGTCSYTNFRHISTNVVTRELTNKICYPLFPILLIIMHTPQEIAGLSLVYF